MDTAERSRATAFSCKPATIRRGRRRRWLLLSDRGSHDDTAGSGCTCGHDDRSRHRRRRRSRVSPRGANNCLLSRCKRSGRSGNPRRPRVAARADASETLIAAYGRFPVVAEWEVSLTLPPSAPSGSPTCVGGQTVYDTSKAAERAVRGGASCRRGQAPVCAWAWVARRLCGSRLSSVA
jgi:hypothetical protein